MSTPSPVFLHEWTISISRQTVEIDERIENGQPVKVSRTVTKDVPVKMALKKLSRREARDADLFYGKEHGRFFNMGFPTRSMVVTRHADVAGGLLSEKERLKIAELADKGRELELEIVRRKDADEEVKKGLRSQIFSIRSQINDYATATESSFAQTCETKAQAQLSTWLAFTLIYIERDGKWVQYFEGQGSTPDETFKLREDFMWKLEEANDEFYLKAIEKISFYVGLMSRGVDTPEQFKLIEDEMEAQAAGRKAEAEKLAAAAKVANEESVKSEKSAETVVMTEPPITTQ